jgi:hypothetical protein
MSKQKTTNLIEVLSVQLIFLSILIQAGYTDVVKAILSVVLTIVLWPFVKKYVFDGKE